MLDIFSHEIVITDTEIDNFVYDEVTEFDLLLECNGKSTRLNDKMVTARKDYKCHHCCGIVRRGKPSRYIAEAGGGKIRSYRFCTECCQAMVIQLWNDCDERFGCEGFPFDDRHELNKV